MSWIEWIFKKFSKEKDAEIAALKLHQEILEKQIVELKEMQPTEKDLQFLEFAVDMYIKYAKKLNIHSKEQHEFIAGELEKIRQKHLLKNSSSSEQHPREQE